MEISFSFSDTKGKLCITNEGKILFESIHEPFGIVGVAGRKRTGKSTLLNFLNNSNTNNKTFQIGASIETVTKGLKVSPFLIRNDSKSTPYLLLDSEGTDSFESSTEQDIEILALMYLFVSIFMLNTKGGGIDQHDFSLLSCLVSTINKLKERNDNFDLGSPKLLWLLRDFSLLLLQNGKNLSAQEYLEQLLEGKQIQNSKKRKKIFESNEEEKRDSTKFEFAEYERNEKCDF